ncbi:MAG: hypothetical protein ACYSUI_06085, partial [Planctomycetota bacterium]
MICEQAVEEPDALQAEQIILKILSRADVFDYGLSVQETDGLRDLVHGIVALQPDKKHKPLARIFANRTPFEDPYRLIPADATS